MHKLMPGPTSILRVQSWDTKAPAPSGVQHLLSIAAWPRETGAVAAGRADVICIGPTDWLVSSTEPDAAELLQTLHAAFAGSTFRATNVSQALTRIEIDGPDARALLAKGCSLDLHPSRFPPGRSARTRFAGMPVIVRCTAQSTFECIVARSYADYLSSWLTDAALEFPTVPGTRVGT